MGAPLEGICVVEVAGIGPGPFSGMILADLGADVIQIHRSVAKREAPDPLDRGKRSVVLNLKHPAAVQALLRLADRADVLIEGYRPGVAERLGFGPELCLDRNPRLIYGRMTGWGQDGPLAGNAGHDINYIALAGALEGLGRAGQPPTPPVNLVGDFGGGAMFLAVGVLAALVERGLSGRGQVVDAAIVDGAALLMAIIYGMQGRGFWHQGRGTNLLDTGSARYEVYQTADDKWVSVGTLEERFYRNLIRILQLEGDPDMEADLNNGLRDLSGANSAKAKLKKVFRTRTRDEWCALLEGETEMCFAPVLDMNEAPEHPHLKSRGSFVEVGGIVQPAPAPRFGRSIVPTPAPAPARGEHTEAVLSELGLSAAEIAELALAPDPR
ncbi:MAG TPA: CaiB/BaiF CoA-transferase family protein [Acidimicrobiales bacterium]|nr:CaiB/BaiF CoA-transferase family protein [Acidimicrobiales bacterium]